MYRRPLGRPRVIAVLAALVMLVGCVLPWWASSGPRSSVTRASAPKGSGARR